MNKIKTLEEVEKNYILSTLAENKDTKIEALAKMLGMGKTTLYRKLREYKGK